MATATQRAARKHIAKVQRVRRSMSSQSRVRAHPEGRDRAKPGTRGSGAFFHIEVRPRREFNMFRTQDVGKTGGIERVAGKRSSGSWDTQKWLISKAHAHRVRGRLLPDTADARKVLAALGAPPHHIGGDRFRAKDRPNIPERAKPTPAMQRARGRNIRKAQAARRRHQ